MRFGLMMPFQNPPRWARPYPALYREFIEQTVLAEELGYDAIWPTEHHFDVDGWSPSLLPLAAGIATRTTRIRIGPFILILPFQHALRVAGDASAWPRSREDSAVHDDLCQGSHAALQVSTWLATPPVTAARKSVHR